MLLVTPMFFSCTHVISHDSSTATSTHHLFKDKMHSHFHIKFITNYRKSSIHIFLHFTGFFCCLPKKPPKIATTTHQNYIYHQTKLKNPPKEILKNLLMLHANFLKKPLCNQILHKYTKKSFDFYPTLPCK